MFVVTAPRDMWAFCDKTQGGLLYLTAGAGGGCKCANCKLDVLEKSVAGLEDADNTSVIKAGVTIRGESGTAAVEKLNLR